MAPATIGFNSGTTTGGDFNGPNGLIPITYPPSYPGMIPENHSNESGAVVIMLPDVSSLNGRLRNLAIDLAINRASGKSGTAI